MKHQFWFMLPILWLQGFLVSPDLVKLPILFAHFLEHQATSEELDLTSFIALHYADEEHQADDHDRHENLPFHHHHGAVVDQHFAKMMASDPQRHLRSTPSMLSTVALRVDMGLLAGHHSEPLHPPRTLA
ncbi:MAG: hypothetical protein IPF64_12190 [Flavobacteriales bacterium]|jgi:hypothetical protein|nr:hypothetical protein [Flavobacteriales bacterium]